MKKYIGKVVLGSVMCVSSMAFAGESTTSAVSLSDQQMDSVTAGTSASSSSFNWQSIYQRQGGTTNVNVSPTLGANLAILTFGGRQSVSGGNTYQTGGIQIAGNRN